MKSFESLAAIAAIGIVVLLWAGHARAAENIKVVELFTSQGCSSCPPADRLLQQLSTRPDIIALSYHINYWDYIGWKDPFASEASTQRQRAYNRTLRRRNVFTPQMIINGGQSVVGSRHAEVERGLHASHPLSDTLTISQQAGQVTLSGATGQPLDVWLIEHQPRGQSSVARGENRGRELSHVNIVRQITPLAAYRGEAQSYALPPTNAAYKRIILLQDAGFGRIRAAAHLR